nr:MAG: hypothetical protein DIU78_23520 [Pseudomonadota bacterium]
MRRRDVRVGTRFACTEEFGPTPEMAEAEVDSGKRNRALRAGRVPGARRHAGAKALEGRQESALFD